MVRFAVITDIHYGLDRRNKLGSRAPALVERFINAVNRRRLDFTIDLGDRINHVNANQDRHYQECVSEHFNRLAHPHFAIDGNHDVVNLPRSPSRTAIIGGHTLILWSPDLHGGPNGFSAAPDDMDWLQQTLKRAAGPCIFASHIPVDNQDNDNAQAMKRDARPWLSFLPQGPAIRRMLEESSKVILCLSGHRHCNRRREINGIHYLTMQSLVQRHGDSRTPKGAFYMIEIDDRKVKVNGFGRGQKSFSLALMPAAPCVSMVA